MWFYRDYPLHGHADYCFLFVIVSYAIDNCGLVMRDYEIWALIFLSLKVRRRFLIVTYPSRMVATGDMYGKVRKKKLNSANLQ